MIPFVITVLAIFSATNADVSHLSGYQYTPGQNYNFGTSSLKLHSTEQPAPTQFHATYGDVTNVQSQLPTSYVPPASGNPFDSTVPLTSQYPIQQLQAPLQIPNAFQAYQPSLYQQQQSYQPTIQRSQTTYQNLQQATLQSQSQSQTTGSNFGFAQQNSQHTAQQSQEPIVTKHFYVHAAPEEPEEPEEPQFVHVGRPQKTYKIIFIKAPTYASQSRIIPIFPQNEEKTIVYVLSKKPELSQDIQLPQPKTTEPTKPEVFFIKYKTQQEAEQAQQSIQAAYDSANAASAVSSDVDQAQSFDVRSTFSTNSESGSSSFGGQESSSQQSHQQNQAAHSQQQQQQHGGR